ncbi:MAG: hypothetical protein M1830_001836 [Pleopsidium flavum]|nr:MAG: hypothetical protein M1830_001836 [Pleopsidium flavum]
MTRLIPSIFLSTLLLACLLSLVTTSPTPFTDTEMGEVEALRASGVSESEIYTQITHHTPRTPQLAPRAPAPGKYDAIEKKVLAHAGYPLDVIDRVVAIGKRCFRHLGGAQKDEGSGKEMGMGMGKREGEREGEGEGRWEGMVVSGKMGGLKGMFFSGSFLRRRRRRVGHGDGDDADVWGGDERSALAKVRGRLAWSEDDLPGGGRNDRWR